MKDNLLETLEAFPPIKNCAMRWILCLLPYAIFLLIVMIVCFCDNDPMYISGLVADALSLLAFQFLMYLIQSFFI